MSTTPYNVVFNGYSLQSSSFRTRIIQHTNIPTRLIQSEPRARADGQNLVNVRLSTRVIDVEGVMAAADRQSLVTLIDQMKLQLSGASGTLDIDYGNSVRRYYATVQNLELPEDFYNISQAPYKVTFFCADPFGYLTNSGVISVPATSNLLQDTLITLSGSADTEPAITLTVNTQNAMSLLTVSNETDGDVIVISKPGGNFSNGDVILINSRLKTVQINNSGVDYSGRFPILTQSQCVIRIAIAATAANWQMIINYPPKFL